MLESLKQLISLQRLHTERAEATKALAALPARRAEAEKAFKEFEKALQTFTDRITELRKAIRSSETDIEALKEERKKYESQLLSVKTNEAYRALLREIEGVKERIGNIEEKILDFMTEEEEVRRKAEAKKKEEPEAKRALEAALAEIASEESRLRTRLAEIGAAWDAETKGIASAHFALFDRLVKSRHGVAVSRLDGETCEACAMHVRPHLIQQIREDREVLLCENCGRILYREDSDA